MANISSGLIRFGTLAMAGIVFVSAASLILPHVLPGFDVVSPRTRKDAGVPTEKRAVREFRMRAVKDQWTFDPAVIAVRKGDRVMLRIKNEDAYAHGFAVAAFGVNALLPPETETVVEFIADQSGTFALFCSVPCGEGHFRMTGSVVVGS